MATVELQTALQKFAGVFNNSKVCLGKISYVPFGAIPKSSMPLEGILAVYYRLLCIESAAQIGGQFQFTLYPAADLARFQYGWHWITNKSGETVENPNWPAHWVLIGDRSGDAIFVDTSSGSVLGSIQQRNMLLAADLAQFYDVVSGGMIIEMHKYHFNVQNEDFSPTQEFLDDIMLLLQTKLGAEKSANFNRFFFG